MNTFATGLDALLAEQSSMLGDRRVGLVAHPASITAHGVHASDALRTAGVRLHALFGPEHGYAGRGDAGEAIGDAQHEAWRIPVYSLYGETRKPTATMLEDLDVIVVDLQDISVRCYTYIATLRNVLEAAAAYETEVIVCDRPSPLARTVDGPCLEPTCESFVSSVPAPMVYGMTQGEAATWLKKVCDLHLQLTVVPSQGYHHDGAQPDALTWIPPSPAIRSWTCAQCYPATVFTEALPSLTCARSTEQAFQVLTAPWIDAEHTAASLNASELSGVRFAPYREEGETGIRLEITEPLAFRPVTAGVHLLANLRDLYSDDKLWGHPDTRAGFFDQLIGTPHVREALRMGAPAEEITGPWEASHASFLEERKACLLYEE